ncbi:MAG: hypothetical protein ACK48E_08740, partial [Holosporales bacterium]
IKQLIVTALGALQIVANGLLPATAAPVSTNPIEPDAPGKKCAAVIIKDTAENPLEENRFHHTLMQKTIEEELSESHLKNENVVIHQTDMTKDFRDEKQIVEYYRSTRTPVIMNLSFSVDDTMEGIRKKYVANKQALQKHKEWQKITKILEEKYGPDLSRLTLFQLERDPRALLVVEEISGVRRRKVQLRQIFDNNPYVTAYIAAGNGPNNGGPMPGGLSFNLFGLGGLATVVGSDPQGLTNKAGSVMPTLGYTKIMTPIFRGFSGPYYDGGSYLMVDYNGDGKESTKMPISPAEAKVIEQYSGQNIHAIKAAGNFISLEEYQRQHNNPSHLPKDRHQEWLEKVTANAVVGTEYPSIFQVFIKTDDGRLKPFFLVANVKGILTPAGENWRLGIDASTSTATALSTARGVVNECSRRSVSSQEQYEEDWRKQGKLLTERSQTFFAALKQDSRH